MKGGGRAEPPVRLQATAAAAEEWRLHPDDALSGAGNKDAQQAEAIALQHELAAAAVQLSSRRRAAAGRLRAAVEGCLADLAMGGCRFDVMLRWQPAAAHVS